MFVVVLVDKGKKPGGCGWSGERGDDVRRGLGRGRFVERGAAGGPHGMAWHGSSFPLTMLTCW